MVATAPIAYRECPYCQEKRGNRGSSSWGHNYLCCSEKCGKELGEKLRENRASPEYKEAEERLGDIYEELHYLEWRGIKYFDDEEDEEDDEDEVSSLGALGE